MGCEHPLGLFQASVFRQVNTAVLKPVCTVRMGKLGIGRCEICCFKLSVPYISCHSEWRKLLTKQSFFVPEVWLIGWPNWKQKLAASVEKVKPEVSNKLCVGPYQELNYRMTFIFQLIYSQWESTSLTTRVFGFWSLYYCLIVWLWKRDVMFLDFVVYKMSRLD